MEINKITIEGGFNKSGKPEAIESVDFFMGQVISIVGPTGCGKTTFINDIELFANRNTPTGRRILINDEVVNNEIGNSEMHHPIALISQHTNFLSDLPVGEFLKIHATVREAKNTEAIINETLEFANQLTGEAIVPKTAMTELSGGQTRSLLIADAVIIGNSPIILLDEIENAGIHRTKALEMLKGYNKIFVFVTHDPRIAMLSDYRLVMKNGGIIKMIKTEEEEKLAVKELAKIDDMMLEFRTLIRSGEKITCDLFNTKKERLIEI